MAAVQPRSPRPAPRPPTDVPAVSVALDRRRRAVYRRRRTTAVVFLFLLIAAILVLAFVGGRATADGSSSGEVRPAAVYVVRPGDTLWDLALALAPDRDPRGVVAALERAAGGTTLQPGQRIVVPASLQR